MVFYVAGRNKGGVDGLRKSEDGARSLKNASDDAILDAMDAEHGPPKKAAQAWAKRVLRRP